MPPNGGGPLLAVLRRAEKASRGGLMPAPCPPLEVAPSSPRSAPRMRSRVSSCPSGKISSQSSCSPERASHAHHARTMHPMPARVSIHAPWADYRADLPASATKTDSTSSAELLDEPGGGTSLASVSALAGRARQRTLHDTEASCRRPRRARACLGQPARGSRRRPPAASAPAHAGSFLP